MNRDAPKEIIEAAHFHGAGPFQPVYQRDALEVLTTHERISYARVQYFPKRRIPSKLFVWITNRAECWEILSQQQIPGCPDDGQNHWRKMHTKNYWAWYYEAGR